MNLVVRVTLVHLASVKRALPDACAAVLRKEVLATFARTKGADSSEALLVEAFCLRTFQQPRKPCQAAAETTTITGGDLNSSDAPPELTGEPRRSDIEVLLSRMEIANHRAVEDGTPQQQEVPSTLTDTERSTIKGGRRLGSALGNRCSCQLKGSAKSWWLGSTRQRHLRSASMRFTRGSSICARSSRNPLGSSIRPSADHAAATAQRPRPRRQRRRSVLQAVMCTCSHGRECGRCSRHQRA